MNAELEQIGKNAACAKYGAGLLTTEQKNEALLKVADALVAHSDQIIAANDIDMKNGKEAGMKAGLLDRLLLTKERIEGIAEGLRQITELPDPIGILLESFERPNGMHIEKITVPMGVIGIIYESRPNVTADAFGLFFKAGSAVILKGGSDAIHSNSAITDCIADALEEYGLDRNLIQLIRSTDREVTREFMKMKEYVDLLIPRGGAGLIRATVENSTIPVYHLSHQRSPRILEWLAYPFVRGSS